MFRSIVVVLIFLVLFSCEKGSEQSSKKSSEKVVEDVKPELNVERDFIAPIPEGLTFTEVSNSYFSKISFPDSGWHILNNNLDSRSDDYSRSIRTFSMGSWNCDVTNIDSLFNKGKGYEKSVAKNMKGTLPLEVSKFDIKPLIYKGGKMVIKFSSDLELTKNDLLFRKYLYLIGGKKRGDNMVAMIFSSKYKLSEDNSVSIKEFENLCDYIVMKGELK